MTDREVEHSRPEPFPGLRPYEPHESMFFFGREGETDELVRLLGRTRLVAVVGGRARGSLRSCARGSCRLCAAASSPKQAPAGAWG
jgi:hypothetical protein